MQPDKPKINFLFPFRWISDKEDSQYLAENIQRQVIKYIGGQENLELLEGVLAYKVVIFYQSSKPLELPFTKAQAQKIFKPVFPNGKCLSVDIEYHQHRSKTMLPILDMRIFF